MTPTSYRLTSTHVACDANTHVHTGKYVIACTDLKPPTVWKLQGEKVILDGHYPTRLIVCQVCSVYLF